VAIHLTEFTAHRAELRCDTAGCAAVFTATTDSQHHGGHLYLLVAAGAAGWSMPTLDHLESTAHHGACDCVTRCPACTAGADTGPVRAATSTAPGGPMYVVVELGDPTGRAHVVNGAEIITDRDTAFGLADDYNHQAAQHATPGRTAPLYELRQLVEVPAR
jgi:hypothetical protein